MLFSRGIYSTVVASIPVWDGEEDQLPLSLLSDPIPRAPSTTLNCIQRPIPSIQSDNLLSAW